MNKRQKNSILLRRKKTRGATHDNHDSRLFDDQEIEEEKMIPEDQLELTDAELDEEFTKTLTSVNTDRPSKITKFNFKTGEFISEANNDHLAVFFCVDGIICHASELVETPENEEEIEQTTTAQQTNEEKSSEENGNENPSEEKEENAEAQPKEEETNEEAEEEVPKKSPHKALVKNQFNFSERASQTFNHPMRNREVLTEPPPTSVFSQNASRAAIYDEYFSNLQKLEKLNPSKSVNAYKEKEEKAEPKDITLRDSSDALLHSKEMSRALKIAERVVGQNADQHNYFEFKYYKEEDYKSSPFLLHLWTFRYPAAKNKMVTCMCWNTQHDDLFAVGYGSYDFHRQTHGVVCVYSLKATNHPTRVIRVESGVMALHFHPEHPSLLCVGAYDGSVAVYDIRNRDDTPIYSSENPELHHRDPVWEIRWSKEDIGQPTAFYSISSEGIIKKWSMSKNELTTEIIMELKQPMDLTTTQQKSNEMKENSNINAKSSGDNSSGNKEETSSDENLNEREEMNELHALCLSLCSCLDFNSILEHLFLVGTEDGNIFLCSKTFTDGFMKRYEGHSMNVYALRWNPFHPKTFISASEDWTVKLWDSDDSKPIISYDLNTSVGDIAWAPFSSTVFAAATSDGRVHVFDLQQNKNGPLYSERVTKKGGLTHLAFAPSYPVIIVGDERGTTLCLKLSPQLFQTSSSGATGFTDLNPESEKAKLERILKVTGSKVLDLRQQPKPQILS